MGYRAMSAGKGSKPRPIDRKGWEESKLWDNIEKKARNERIFQENKHLIEGSGIEMAKRKDSFFVHGDEIYEASIGDRFHQTRNGYLEITDIYYKSPFMMIKTSLCKSNGEVINQYDQAEEDFWWEAKNYDKIIEENEK